MNQRAERLRLYERQADKLRAGLLLLARETELEGFPGEAARLSEHSASSWRIQNDISLIRLDIKEREAASERRRERAAA